MKFNSVEDRIAAIKVQTEKLGQAYGQLKFEEAMMREISQSYIDDKSPSDSLPTVTATVTNSEPEPEAKPVAKKRTTRKKKEKPVEQPKPTPEDTKEASASEDTPVEQPETSTTTTSGGAEADTRVAQEVQAGGDSSDTVTEECPITSVDDLREFMTKRYKELGGTPDVRGTIVAALKDATGKDKAQDITEPEFEAAYNAIASL